MRPSGPKIFSINDAIKIQRFIQIRSLRTDMSGVRYFPRRMIPLTVMIAEGSRSQDPLLSLPFQEITHNAGDQIDRCYFTVRAMCALCEDLHCRTWQLPADGVEFPRLGARVEAAMDE